MIRGSPLNHFPSCNELAEQATKDEHTMPHTDLGYCPTCHSDLQIEPDPRMRTGYALVCENPECADGGGAWGATEVHIRKAGLQIIS